MITLREFETPPTAFPRLRLRLEGVAALGSLCVFLILNLIFVLDFKSELGLYAPHFGWKPLKKGGFLG